MTDAELEAAAERLLHRSTAASGVPLHLEDADAIRRIATIVGRGLTNDKRRGSGRREKLSA